MWWYSGFALTYPDGGELGVGLEPRPPTRSLGGPKDEFRPNRTVAGKPAMWTAGATFGELRMNDYGQLFDLYVREKVEADVLAVAAGLTLVGDLRQPGTWAVP